MSKKLDNLMGKGFFLPEHLAGLGNQEKELSKRKRVELDDQELEMISRVIHESMDLHKPITLSLYDEFEDLKAIGIIESIDAHKQRVRIDGEWFKVADIVGVGE